MIQKFLYWARRHRAVLFVLTANDSLDLPVLPSGLFSAHMLHVVKNTTNMTEHVPLDMLVSSRVFSYEQVVFHSAMYSMVVASPEEPREVRRKLCLIVES